jgi:hypothetical protein
MSTTAAACYSQSCHALARCAGLGKLESRLSGQTASTKLQTLM